MAWAGQDHAHRAIPVPVEAMKLVVRRPANIRRIPFDPGMTALAAGLVRRMF
jgi:hypothetical protein